MLQLRCTGKIQKEFKLKPSELSEILEPDSTLGNWYINISIIDRRKTLLFMNEKTLLSFIVYGIKKSNIGHIHEIFLKSLGQLLLIEGVNFTVINKLNNEYCNLEYTKTNSKNLLGNMNDLMHLYKHFIYSNGGFKHCDLDEIIKKTNRIPKKNIGWSDSINLTKKSLPSKK